MRVPGSTTLRLGFSHLRELGLKFLRGDSREYREYTDSTGITFPHSLLNLCMNSAQQEVYRALKACSVWVIDCGACILEL